MEFSRLGRSGQQVFTNLQTRQPHIQIQLEEHASWLQLTLFCRYPEISLATPGVL